jgi:hypothetical protein
MKRDDRRISIRWGQLATSGVIHFGIEHSKTLLDKPAVAPGGWSRRCCGRLGDAVTGGDRGYTHVSCLSEIHNTGLTLYGFLNPLVTPQPRPSVQRLRCGVLCGSHVFPMITSVTICQFEETPFQLQELRRECLPVLMNVVRHGQVMFAPLIP